VAVVTLGLHAGAFLGHSGGHSGAGHELSMAALAVVALGATWAGFHVAPGASHRRPDAATDGQL
jgi:hypothetical protein